MGRKSLANERSNQILDAFEHCISEYGLQGATLQRTAEQAEINIGMIHHYIGTRDDLLKAMVNRFIEKTQQEIEAFIEVTPADLRLPYLFHHLFEEDEDIETARIMNELFIASNHNEFVRGLLQEIHQFYEDFIATEIDRTYPHLGAASCQDLGFALLSLAYGAGLLGEIGLERRQKSISQFADLLLQTAANQPK